MTSTKIIDSHREGAEVYHGHEECRKESIELLGKLGLPNGLLPLEDIAEFGYNRATGFMWMIQKKSTTYTFKKIDRQVSFAAEVTAFLQHRSIKKLSGVKTREMLMWITVGDIYFENATTQDLTFRSPSGISDSCVASVFNLD